MSLKNKSIQIKSIQKFALMALLGLVIVLPIYYVFQLQFNEPKNQSALANNQKTNKPVAKIKLNNKPTYLYNIPIDSFNIEKQTIKSGESLGKILDNAGIQPQQVFDLINASKNVFNVRHIKAGANYTLIKTLDTTQALKYFVYEKSLTEYVVFDLQDSLKVYVGTREVTSKQNKAIGVIHSSLSKTISDLGLSQTLAHRMEDIYAWSINFFRLQPGDKFEVVFNEDYIDDTLKVSGSEKILAAIFTHQGREYKAYSFVTPEGWTEYYDEEGRSLRKSFLMAPLKTYRISSRFTRNRFHPVQKRWKAHKGTDFAAPHGTPIMSTANGTVIKVGYTSGNGNYVKVKHSSKYTTQYLHMSKFPKGLKEGQRVKQGDVIGYVGSTGLATGPHVCYRFWVNGVQQDPYQQKLPEATPIKAELKADFEKQMAIWNKAFLNAIPEA